jgi:hypothetical protein
MPKYNEPNILKSNENFLQKRVFLNLALNEVAASNANEVYHFFFFNLLILISIFSSEHQHPMLQNFLLP